jgi:hypothetical protein
MDNFIEVYEKVFDAKFCNTMIDCFNNAETMGFCKIRQEENSSVNKLQKDDSMIFYPQSLRLNSFDNDLVSHFNNTLNNSLRLYESKYASLCNLPPMSSHIIKMQKTLPGQGYHIWHCEHSNAEMMNRVLTWTAYMNDDFDAGETEFLYQQYRYKPQQGDIVIFPAAFTHTHRGNPPYNGTKYIITGWVEF